MATVKETMRQCLLTYPNIFPSPFHVACQWFAVCGNGMEWTDRGELVSPYDEVMKTEMDYSDIIEDIDRIKADAIRYPDSVDVNIDLLEPHAHMVARKFIADNIDAVCDDSITKAYFGSNLKGGSYVNKTISLTYCAAYNFPPNISLDWATALYEFLQHWLYILNMEYGVSGKDPDNRSFWPADIQRGRADIISTLVRLHPIIHDGQTYEETQTRLNNLLEDLLTDFKKND